MRKFALALAAVAALAIAAPAQSAIIISEDFESGLGAFTATGQAGINTGNGYQSCCNTTGSAANMANHFVAFGSGDLPSGLISAPISLVPGTIYNLGFDFGELGAGSEQAFVTIDGVTYPLSRLANNDMDSTFIRVQIGFTAINSSTTLQFTSSGGASVDSIVDRILLTGLAGAVPEPSTWAMMLLGFGAIGLAARRRRRMTSAIMRQA